MIQLASWKEIMVCGATVFPSSAPNPGKTQNEKEKIKEEKP